MRALAVVYCGAAVAAAQAQLSVILRDKNGIPNWLAR